MTPSKREADYKRIFEDPTWHPVKSMFVGDQDMPILLANDIESAEIMALGRLAHDDNMLHILTTPGRDIHGEMAIRAFQLKYDPNCGVIVKKWINGVYTPCEGVVEKITEFPDARGADVWISGTKVVVWPGHKPAVKVGDRVKQGQLISTSFKHYRVSAKSIIFGIPYGRGLRAFAREIGQSGVTVTLDQVAGLVGNYHEMFPKVQPFLDFCKASVHNPGYLDSVYGRRRFFYQVGDKSAMAAQEREACNWPKRLDWASIKQGEFRESRYGVDLQYSANDSRAGQQVTLSQARVVTLLKVQRLGAESLVDSNAPTSALAAKAA